MHAQILCSGSSASVASRRIRSTLGAVLGRNGWMSKTHEVKLHKTSSGNLLLCKQIALLLGNILATVNRECCPENIEHIDLSSSKV